METSTRLMTAREKIRKLVEVKEQVQRGNGTRMTLSIGRCLKN